MHRRAHRSARPWVAAGVLIAGNLLLHKPISDVCDALFARIGRTPYEWAMLAGIGALSASGAVLLIRGGLWRTLARPRQAIPLAALAVATVLSQRWLLVSNVELIHLPQFGLLAALLLAAGLPPERAWIGATAGGVLDETYQHLVIYAGVPGTYFDFNDIVLNAIGAAWVVVLAGSFRSRPAERPLKWAAAAALVALAAAWWIDPPQTALQAAPPFVQPALKPAATGRTYHVMPASEGLAALLALWGLVAVAGGDLVAGARWSRIALLPLLILLHGCAAAQPARPESRPLPRFLITLWCGPPLPLFTDDRAAEIAAAGFNLVGAPCEGAINPVLSRRALDVAARHGLRLLVNDRRVDQYHGLRPAWASEVSAAVADYGAHPALGGYFLIDEPSADRFDELALIVERLRQIDPDRLPYINLYPDFAPAGAFGTDSYREYVERFVETVRPPLLSFDYYPFGNGADRATFFHNLDLIREVAQRHGIPFLLIVQAMPHGPYRDPSEAELAWQVFHAMAYGAGGISYFAYWTPVRVREAERWQFRRGLIEAGAPTEHYHHAARINRVARALADELADFRWIAVADSEGRLGTPLPIGPIEAITGGPVTAGFFGDREGALAVLLVNRDYRAPVTAGLQLRAGAPLPLAFDPVTGRWRSLHEAAFRLPPGEPQLLRWR